MTDERDPWPGIDAVLTGRAAKYRQLAADLRGAATFRPRQAARYEQEARRLEKMADAAEKSLE